MGICKVCCTKKLNTVNRWHDTIGRSEMKMEII